MASTSVEQLEKLVGQEYAAEPVSTCCPTSLPQLIPQLRLAGTSGTSSRTPLELVQIHLRSNSCMVCYVPSIPPKSCLTFPHSRTRYILMFSLMSSTHSPLTFPSLRPFVCCLPHLPSRLLPQGYYSHVFTVPVPFTSVTGVDQEVVNFNDRISTSNSIKGLPKFDPRRVVHASQTIEVLKPLPLVSGPGWKLKMRLASIRENSSCHPTYSISRRVHQPNLYLPQSLASSSRASTYSWTPMTRLMLVSLCVHSPPPSPLRVNDTQPST